MASASDRSGRGVAASGSGRTRPRPRRSHRPRPIPARDGPRPPATVHAEPRRPAAGAGP
ncbi:hypothetical protein MGSAQ_002931 [marine sediment metagenome]|uniref:Uncharacterized protein n=1 Tax=marine sediment metagenome TaxID=412755 RepID=A0A1B6NQ54_9ZZZZ